MGGVIGLIAAVVLGWVIFVAGRKLDVRVFFKVTGLLLILFAAGLLAHGVHELQEAALLPIVVEHVYDINLSLDEDGVVGSFLKALFGYNGNPSLVEATVYVLYIVLVGMASYRWLGRVYQADDNRVDQSAAMQRGA